MHLSGVPEGGGGTCHARWPWGRTVLGERAGMPLVTPATLGWDGASEHRVHTSRPPAVSVRTGSRALANGGEKGSGSSAVGAGSVGVMSADRWATQK